MYRKCAVKRTAHTICKKSSQTRRAAATRRFPIKLPLILLWLLIYLQHVLWLPSCYARLSLSLFLLHCHSWTPAPFALWIAGCPPLSPPLSIKPDPAFTSASQTASTNAGFQFPPDVKFQPSPRNPPPALALASWAGKPSYAQDFVRDVCREAAVLFTPYFMSYFFCSFSLLRDRKQLFVSGEASFLS